MTKQIRVRGVRRREVDVDRLAVAFLLLAKILHEQEQQQAKDDEAAPGGDCGGEPS